MLAIAALRAHGLGPRWKCEAAAHHKQEAHGAGSLHRRPPSVQRPDRPLGPPALCLLCIPLGLARVAKWPLSDSAPRSSPSSALCPVAGPGLCRRASLSQVRRRRALRELRVLLVAFLQKNVSPGARRGAEGGARTEVFLCSSSPESWIPWHGFSPPSGFPSCRREPFQELLGARLGCCAAAAQPPQPAPPRSGSGTGSAVSVEEPGEEPRCAGCVRKGPKSASGEETGRKFVLPTLCPPGMQARKEETAEGGQTPAGGGGSASGQPESGTPSTTPREVWAARSPPAFYRSFGEHSLSAKSCWRAAVSRG